MVPPRIFLTLLVQILAIITSCICHDLPKFPAIFTFGDALVDSGNNNFLATLIKANHPPYGISFPGFAATGRFSDGKLISDFLASELGIKQTIPPFLDPNLSLHELKTGVCFGSAGSGFDDLTSALTNVIPVSKQPLHFQKYIEKLKEAVGDVVARQIISNSLAFIAAGSSDFYVNFYTAPTRQIHLGLSGYQDFLQLKIRDLIKTLYNMGCRNMLIAGLPPMGCKPLEMTTKLSFGRCVEDENRDAQSYNLKLMALLPQIQATLPGSKLVYADLYQPVMDMMNNSLTYGFTVTNRGCCGTGILEAGYLCKVFSPVCANPAQYIFWDSANPTQAANLQMAQCIKHHSFPLFLVK